MPFSFGNKNTMSPIVIYALSFICIALGSGVDAYVAKIFGRDVAVPQSMLDQVPLIRAAEAIQAALPPLAYNGSDVSSGYAGMIFTSNSIELWWKGGRLDSAVSAVLDSIKNVKIDVREARFSLAELKKVAAPLNAYIRKQNAFHGVSIPSNGSSIVIHGDSAQVASAARGADPTAVLTSVLPDELKKLNLDVPLVVQSEPSPVVSQRYNDGFPVEGGIAICQKDLNAPNVGRCTAGFIVRNNQGVSFILTAYHCGQATFYTCNPPRRGITNDRIGPSASWVLQRDTMLIRTDVSVNGAVWDGPASGGEFLRGVAAFHTILAVGMQYCQSGEISGTVCGIRVDVVNKNICYTQSSGAVPPFCVQNMAEGIKMDGGTSICEGDSGGPMFSLDTQGRIWGLGINSGMYVSPCGNRMIFSPIQDAVSIYGISPVLG
ncbi:hypothetical protein BJ742DRAFT_116355 [Cladochytrium replicatum]|nr:hypothetical protein BJ742DRAFT_116355 [Cladochytrium replicatum]